MRWVVIGVMLAGCGRVRFDPLDDASTVDAFAGPSGMALRTTGTGSYATIDSVCSSLTGAYTINAWVHPDTPQGDNYAALFAINSNTGNANYSLIMWDTNAEGRIDYFDDFYTNGVENPFTGAGGRWNFLSAVLDAAGSGVMYQNGEVSNTFTSVRTVTAPCKFSIGQEWDGTNASDFFAGFYDEISVWSVAKSQAEIMADMRANPSGGEPGLVGYYNFESPFAGTLVSATIVPGP